MTGLDQPYEYSTADISCYPNPFNSSTVIYLSGFDPDARLSVKIYDLLGRQVRSFRDLYGPENSIAWDGTDDYANRLSSGIYFVRAEASNFGKTVKILLIK